MGIVGAAMVLAAGLGAPGEHALEVLPAEQRRAVDPQTGVELLFLTTHPARDLNLYFHERSFLADESLVLFISDRPGGGLMGCILATGELVRLSTPAGPLTAATAARTGRRFYALRGRDVLEIGLSISTNPPGASRVAARERLVARLPAQWQPATSLIENADGSLLSVGAASQDGGRAILTIDITSGHVRNVCSVEPGEFAGHVQWSRSDPNLLSYAGLKVRLNVVDVRSGEVTRPYAQAPGELVTHESWWGRGEILFVGGHRENEWHVKTLDPRTGVARIVGAGSWWPGATPRELAKRNWWHAAASEDGAWVAADTFHGSIVLFDARTTRLVELTHGHRTYGGGEHPHVGWDRRGRRVVFASNFLGDWNVCLAAVPEPGAHRERAPRTTAKMPVAGHP